MLSQALEGLKSPWVNWAHHDSLAASSAHLWSAREVIANADTVLRTGVRFRPSLHDKGGCLRICCQCVPRSDRVEIGPITFVALTGVSIRFCFVKNAGAGTHGRPTADNTTTWCILHLIVFNVSSPQDRFRFPTGGQMAAVWHRGFTRFCDDSTIMCSSQPPRRGS